MSERRVLGALAAVALATSPMFCAVASAAEDRPSSTVRPRTWPSPIVLLTVDQVAPAKPSVVVVVAPARDTRYQVAPSRDSSFAPFSVALAVSSAVVFVALRGESVRRARRRRP